MGKAQRLSPFMTFFLFEEIQESNRFMLINVAIYVMVSDRTVYAHSCGFMIAKTNRKQNAQRKYILYWLKKKKRIERQNRRSAWYLIYHRYTRKEDSSSWYYSGPNSSAEMNVHLINKWFIDFIRKVVRGVTTSTSFVLQCTLPPSYVHRYGQTSLTGALERKSTGVKGWTRGWRWPDFPLSKTESPFKDFDGFLRLFCNLLKYSSLGFISLLSVYDYFLSTLNTFKKCVYIEFSDGKWAGAWQAFLQFWIYRKWEINWKQRWFVCIVLA